MDNFANPIQGDIYDNMDAILEDIEFARALNRPYNPLVRSNIQWRNWTVTTKPEHAAPLELLRQAHRHGHARLRWSSPRAECYELPYDAPAFRPYPWQAPIDPQWFAGKAPAEIKAGPLAEKEEIKAAESILKGMETKRRKQEGRRYISGGQQEINRKLEEGLRRQKLREAQDGYSSLEEEEDEDMEEPLHNSEPTGTNVEMEDQEPILIESSDDEEPAPAMEISGSVSADSDMEDSEVNDTPSDNEMDEAEDREIDINNVVIQSDADPSHVPDPKDNRTYFVYNPNTPKDAKTIEWYEGTVKKALFDKFGIEVDEVKIPDGYRYYGFYRPYNCGWTDRFLYGHPGHWPFRSEAEFAPHYLFLLRKAAGQTNGETCGCAQCKRKPRAS